MIPFIPLAALVAGCTCYLLYLILRGPQLAETWRDLFTDDTLITDDAFICPRNPVEERRTLSALTESSPLHLVVKR